MSRSSPTESTGNRDRGNTNLLDLDGTTGDSYDVKGKIEIEWPATDDDLDTQHDKVDRIKELRALKHGPQTRERKSVDRQAATYGRQIASSVDTATASELNIHLYAVSNDRQRMNRAQYRKWTAWPLPTAIHPQDQSLDYHAQASRLPCFHSAIPRRLHDPLQDVLVAFCLKITKEILRTQESEGPGVVASPATPCAPDVGVMLHPVLLADNEHASNILRPSIMHIMTKLDDLLEGLHLFRQSYLSMDPPRYLSKSRSRGRSASAHIGRSIEKRKIFSRGSKRSNSSLRDTTATDDSDVPRKGRRTSSSSRDPFQRLLRRRAVLGLRNWEDVLAVAAMRHFDPEALNRARTRCTSLFGQHARLQYLPDPSAAAVDAQSDADNEQTSSMDQSEVEE